jgi:hypothetical protein
MLRTTEGDIAAPEFLPKGLDVMGLVRQLMLPSAETVEKMSYGDPLFRMPTQSNIPITADREYLADVAGMIPFGASAARPTARGIQDLLRQIQTEPPTGAVKLIDEAAQNIAASPLQNPNFRSWFEGSKITDEQGMPLTVYHGSGSADIKEFDLGNYEKVQKGDWGKGVYFTPSEWMAKSYRDTAVKAQDPKIKEALAKEESLAKEFGTRPMMKWMDLQSGKITQDQYDKLGEADDAWRAALKEAEQSDKGKVYDVYLDIKNPYYYTYSGITEPDLADQVRRAGHDGLIIQNEAGSVEEILVFDPKQIKSASENVGTYSQDTANIYRGIGVGGTGLLGAEMMQEEQQY